MNNLGISLCGGGARGIAHVGVLQALEEHGISPTVIAGASAGSIVGTLYAAGKTPLEILALCRDANLFRLFNIQLPTIGLQDLTYLRELLAEVLPTTELSALPKKMFVCVSNLNTGQAEYLSEGDAIEAVVASSAIPLVFNAVELNEQMYVDGGLLDNLPIKPLKEHCDKIIGVNVNAHGYEESVSNILSIGIRCFELVLWGNVKNNLMNCDVIIEPVKAFEFGLFSFHKAEELFEAGYEEAKAKLPILIQENLTAYQTALPAIEPYQMNSIEEEDSSHSTDT